MSQNYGIPSIGQVGVGPSAGNFTASSTGVADAGKGVELGVDGLIDSSMLPQSLTAKYRSAVGQNIASGGNAFVQYDTDITTGSHVTKNAGNDTFTINEDGLYIITGVIYSVSPVGGVGSGSFVEYRIVINGAAEYAHAEAVDVVGGNTGDSHGKSLAMVQTLSAGDTIQFLFAHNNTDGDSRSLATDDRRNKITITKIGV